MCRQPPPWRRSPKRALVWTRSVLRMRRSPAVSRRAVPYKRCSILAHPFDVQEKNTHGKTMRAMAGATRIRGICVACARLTRTMGNPRTNPRRFREISAEFISRNRRGFVTAPRKRPTRENAPHPKTPHARKHPAFDSALSSKTPCAQVAAPLSRAPLAAPSRRGSARKKGPPKRTLCM